MKKYEVNIVARLETTEIVMAENEEQACLLAEQQFGDIFVVYNSDVETYSSFDEIIGYEPEEIK
jgi:hypothetical protein